MFIKKNFVFDRDVALALEMLADDENMTQTALIKKLVRERMRAQACSARIKR